MLAYNFYDQLKFSMQSIFYRGVSGGWAIADPDLGRIEGASGPSFR